MGLIRRIQSAVNNAGNIARQNVRSITSGAQAAIRIGSVRGALGSVTRDLKNEGIRALGRNASQQMSQAPQLSAAQIENEIQTRAQTLANSIIQAQVQNEIAAANGRVYTRFNITQDIVENQKQFVTTGLFSGNAATMSFMYTSSVQTATQQKYYYEVFQKPNINGDLTAEAQFSLTWGHRLGSGSTGDGTSNDSPSRAIYSQYRLLLLQPGDTTFTFANGQSSDYIYVINFNRARIKDKLDPGNWQFTLSNMSSSLTLDNNSYTGSNVEALSDRLITLVDDSGDTYEALTVVPGVGRVFNVVSGSIFDGVYDPTNPQYYGLVYPDMGVIILNGLKMNESLSFNTVTGSVVAGDNSWKLWTAMSGAMSSNRILYPFQARNEETVTSTHYFVRVKNGEYNFSNNPTFSTGSVGEFMQPTFVGDPKVYITTVGMYNDRQELLAVAKLSQAIQKSFSNEALIKIKLDF